MASSVASSKHVPYFKEASLLNNLTHQNIALFQGLSFSHDSFQFITEYMERGSLQDILRKDPSDFDQKKFLRMLEDVSMAMTYLNSQNNMHGNLKMSNVLINSDWSFKLIDFGNHRFNNKIKQLKQQMNKKEQMESPYWFAPEVLRGNMTEHNSDVYSLGVMMW
jgi:abelson tyrosine-protein kinase 1